MIAIVTEPIARMPNTRRMIRTQHRRRLLPLFLPILLFVRAVLSTDSSTTGHDHHNHDNSDSHQHHPLSSSTATEIQTTIESNMDHSSSTSSSIPPDVVAIIPDRTTSYANGVHNGLLLSATKLNLTLEIYDFGNFVHDIAHATIEACIAKPTEEQPKAYIIWPIDISCSPFIERLHETHSVPIIEMNQHLTFNENVYGHEHVHGHHNDHTTEENQDTWSEQIHHSHNESPETNETLDTTGNGHNTMEGDNAHDADTPSPFLNSNVVAYAGQSDVNRATNAGKMMIQAMDERNIPNALVVALGYPVEYGGYRTSVVAFRESISNSSITLVESLPMDWGNQNAYNQMVLILDAMIEQDLPLHGVYAMDDDILLGAYQAIVDRRKSHHRQYPEQHQDHTRKHVMDAGMNSVNDDDHNGHHSLNHWLDEITLVGTGCNGARSLLVDGEQYGTTVESPLFEAILAMDTIHEYFKTGNVTQKLRYTPSPIITGSTVKTLILPFLDELYAADDLCTWNLQYTKANGLTDKYLPSDICNWVECIVIPDALLYAGYTMVAVNLALAAVCAFVVILYRGKRVMALAQPPFLLLVIAGTCIDTCSILFMNQNYSLSSRGIDSVYEWFDSGCHVWPWLISLGQMMTTGTLVAKIYRVKAVTVDASRKATELQRSKAQWNSFRRSKSALPLSPNHERSSTSLPAAGRGIRRVKVTAGDVSGFIVGGLLLDTIILTIWFLTDPFGWDVEVVNEDEEGHILSARGTCTSEGEYFWVYPCIILIFHFSLLSYANLLAYQTRHYHEISDSKMVAICLFNSIQLLLIATIMYALSGDNVAIGYLVRSSYAFLNNAGVLALVVLPKVYASIFGREQKAVTRISGLNLPLTGYSNHSRAAPSQRGLILNSFSRDFGNSSASISFELPITESFDSKDVSGNTYAKNATSTFDSNEGSDSARRIAKVDFAGRISEKKEQDRSTKILNIIHKRESIVDSIPAGNKTLVDKVANKCEDADGDTHRDEDCPSFHEEDDVGSDDYNAATTKSPKEFCEMPEDSEHSYVSLKG